MGIGDITLQVTQNATSYISYVPTGTNEFVILGVSNTQNGNFYHYDPVSGNNMQFCGRATSSDVNGMGDIGKIVITATNYLKTYGTYPCGVTMIQTK